MGAEGAKEVAKGLKANYSLVELSLGTLATSVASNNLQDEGAEAIAKAIRYNHSIKSLNLSIAFA